jgi:hypothetical protein
VKTFNSLAEKTAKTIKDQGTSAKHLGTIRDSIRYTVETPDVTFADASSVVIDRMIAEGFESLKFKNSFGDEGYQGINTTWRDPASGHAFEVQFHTPESFRAKSVTHDLYKVIRRPNTSPATVSELQAQQQVIFGAVPQPPGAQAVGLPDEAVTAPPAGSYVADTSIGQYARKPFQGAGYWGLTESNVGDSDVVHA